MGIAARSLKAESNENEPVRSGELRDTLARSRPLEGAGRMGLAVVAAAALVLATSELAIDLFRKPFGETLPELLFLFPMYFATGVVMLLIAVWTRHRYPEPGRAQYVHVFAAVALATILWSLVMWLVTNGHLLTSKDPRWTLGRLLLDYTAGVMQGGIFTLVITAAWLYTRTETDHATAMAQCAVDSARMDEQAAQARLQMLEAQIEPHFLFNTLAHVKRLYDIDRDNGARMLDNLKAYLAVALPQMRSTNSTLGRELDHARAYLEIQQIRMGRRLAYGIDVAEPLRAANLPPLMLLTLVENAIKHGVSPRPEGGRVDISAAVEAGRLRVMVADTGQGFTKSGGGGTGLANIRARLATKFGTEASLALAFNAPSGVVATILVPYVTADVLESRP
jgi:hypothetical protein